jgi:hypothetical protein
MGDLVMASAGADEQERTMRTRCSACDDRFREIYQRVGRGVPRTVVEWLADDSGPNARALVVHHDERHEEEIERIAQKLGLPYVQ